MRKKAYLNTKPFMDIVKTTWNITNREKENKSSGCIRD